MFRSQLRMAIRNTVERKSVGPMLMRYHQQQRSETGNTDRKHVANRITQHLDNDLELIYSHKMQHADVQKSP